MQLRSFSYGELYPCGAHHWAYTRLCPENKAMAASKAPGELLNWRDIQKMKLSWRVVQESMRLAPPAQLSFREAQEDMSFDGFRIPKSWKVSTDTHRSFWP